MLCVEFGLAFFLLFCPFGGGRGKGKRAFARRTTAANFKTKKRRINYATNCFSVAREVFVGAGAARRPPRFCEKFRNDTRLSLPLFLLFFVNKRKARPPKMQVGSSSRTSLPFRFPFLRPLPRFRCVPAFVPFLLPLFLTVWCVCCYFFFCFF